MIIEDIGESRFIVDIESADELLLFINSQENLEVLADLINKSDRRKHPLDREVYFYTHNHYIVSDFDEYPICYERYPAMHYKLKVDDAIDYLSDLVPHKMKIRD